jgi:peptidoglycan/xylan/chitin deacetylase (PgdA/CDA1 family)
MNNKPNLMFHEILNDSSSKSGWHNESHGKYTISKNKFIEIINKFGDSVNYTFDDGGCSNFEASLELKRRNIKGIFFISTFFVNKSGFLKINQIKEMSKNHYIFSHGHKHLMNNFNHKELEIDWKCSLNFMKSNGFDTTTICLPGGTFSKTHFKVFTSLGIKNIYHSASTNILLRLLFPKQIIYYPRFIVDNKFKNMIKLNYVSVKSHIKQLINYNK